MDGMDKIKAAHDGGCLRFDGALRGVGGCPMAQDDLIGMRRLNGLCSGLVDARFGTSNSEHALDQALSMAADLFSG